MTFKRVYRRRHLFCPQDAYSSFMHARAWLTEQYFDGCELPKDHYFIEISATTDSQDARKKERVIKALSDATGRVYVCVW